MAGACSPSNHPLTFGWAGACAHAGHAVDKSLTPDAT